MYFNFAKDWPALIVMAIFFGFIAFLVINGKKNQKKDKESGKK